MTSRVFVPTSPVQLQLPYSWTVNIILKEPVLPNVYITSKQSEWNRLMRPRQKSPRRHTTRLHPKTATVAEFAVFGDSRRFRWQCGQGFRLHFCCLLATFLSHLNLSRLATIVAVYSDSVDRALGYTFVAFQATLLSPCFQHASVDKVRRPYGSCYVIVSKETNSWT